MIRSMNIPKQLGLSFLAIIASAAIMMIIFYSNISMIRAATDSNNLSQSVYAKALTLETAILRQNSQFRGFLVTSDETYLKSYGEARDEYDRTSRELEALVGNSGSRQLVLESRRETLKWRQDWGDRLINWVRQGRREAAQDAVRNAGAAVLVSKVALPLRDLRTAETKQMERNSARQETAIQTAMIALVAGGLALIGVAGALAVVLSRSIARPITGLTRMMAELAAGKHDIVVPDAARSDELGDMARAVLVFRESAVAKLAADQDRQEAMAGIGRALHRLSEADLTMRLTDVPESFKTLASDFNNAVSRLSDVMGSVRESVDGIKQNSSEISQASDDLSVRSERQAASLQVTVGAMEEITDTIRKGAATADGANRAMADARGEAEQGGKIVRKAVDAMNGIEKASNEIAEIISVIDGIAFQTNLLALNAGVEAARAGDAGRGFAVVASEVRALAQRSADAAKDVKTRILSATEHVTAGVALVGETGNALNRIIDKVASVSEAIGSMASTSDHQSKSIGEMNIAINEMDAVTQQNAAMVEETTAATRLLVQKAEELASAISIFMIESDPRSAPVRRLAPAPVRPARAAAGAARRPLPVVGNLALAPEEDWSTF